MKQTRFLYKIDDKDHVKEVDFIYEPNSDRAVKLPNDEFFYVKKIYDEFTNNNDVQIRYIVLTRYSPHPND